MTRYPAHPVRVAMSFPRAVLHRELVFLHGLEPPRLLTHRFWYPTQPKERCMVRPHAKRGAHEVMAKMFQKIHHCQQFPPSNAVICFAPTQLPTRVRDYAFDPCLLLGQNSADRPI